LSLARTARRLGLAAALLAGAGGVQAASLRYCDRPAKIDAGQQDRLFRFGALVKAELDAAGRPLALVSRSGLNLGWLGLRYSHAGISLRDSPNGAWSVRQLYYACDEARPRIFDQGIAGFLLGTDDPQVGYISLVFLPPADGEPVARLAGSPRQALELLAADYSANAYAFASRYQNCNQWLAELLGTAWSGESLDVGADGDSARARAQRGLRAQGYAPMVFDLWPPLTLASAFVPWLHTDDHPSEDRAHAVFRVAMPAAIEAFVRTRSPGATRVELCHAGSRVVVHRGWGEIAEGCVPGEGDEVVDLS
jgi:hypothetical protein